METPVLTSSITGDETAKFNAYSSSVHTVVLMVNTGMIGLLQLIKQESSVFETHKAQFLCYFIFILFYAVLRIREASDVRIPSGLVQRLVGHTSHLFGVLAAIMLISVVCAVFAMFLLLLWFLWFSAVAYDTFCEVIIMYSEANTSIARSSQSLPV